MNEDFDVMGDKITASTFISILKQGLEQYKWFTDGCENKDELSVFDDHFKNFDRYLGDLSSHSDFFETAFKKAKSGY